MTSGTAPESPRSPGALQLEQAIAFVGTINLLCTHRHLAMCDSPCPVCSRIRASIAEALCAYPVAAELPFQGQVAAQRETIAAQARDVRLYRQGIDDLASAGVYMIALLQRARLHVHEHRLAGVMDEFLNGVDPEHRAAAADIDVTPALSGQEAQGAATGG